MHIKAHYLGSLWVNKIRDLRQNKRRYLGEVINVFSKTINIKTYDGGLLTVTTRWYRSPIYINCETELEHNFQNLVKVFERVKANSNTIRIGKKLIIEIPKNASIYEPKALKLSKEKLNFHFINKKSLKNILKKILFVITTIGKEQTLINTPKYADFIIEKMSYYIKLIERYIKGEINDKVAINELSRILGVGFGFTPSTDDFVSGLLAFLNIFLIKYKLAAPLKIPLNILELKTTWVSSRLINYNQHGLLIEPLDNAISAILRGNLNEFFNFFLDNLSIGHTSGIDMFLGVLTALTTCYNLMHVSKT